MEYISAGIFCGLKHFLKRKKNDVFEQFKGPRATPLNIKIKALFSLVGVDLFWFESDRSDQDILPSQFSP